MSRLDDATITQLTKEVFRKVNNIRQMAAAAALGSLGATSPVWTGWYKNNHRVAYGNSVELQPSERPSAEDTEGQPVSSLDITSSELLQREVSTLTKATELKNPIVIGNGVPYSPLVENGTLTFPQGGHYALAKLAAEAQINKPPKRFSLEVAALDAAGNAPRPKAYTGNSTARGDIEGRIPEYIKSAEASREIRRLQSKAKRPRKRTIITKSGVRVRKRAR